LALLVAVTVQSMEVPIACGEACMGVNAVIATAAYAGAHNMPSSALAGNQARISFFMISPLNLQNARYNATESLSSTVVGWDRSRGRIERLQQTARNALRKLSY
jgi:hypothetical protein